jgi:hypothetical protein
VVSMGSRAASGGYYMACGADASLRTIHCDRSIGIIAEVRLRRASEQAGSKRRNGFNRPGGISRESLRTLHGG